MPVPQDIQSLARQVPAPPGEPLPSGVSEPEIERFTSETGVPVPEQMRQWLQFTNGPCIGPGGFFGVNPARQDLDMEAMYQMHPQWREQKMIPVAGDGCGNHYLLLAEPRFGLQHGVVFYDHESPQPDGLVYAVSSDLWRFVRPFLLNEIQKSRWPFVAEETLRDDPELAHSKLCLPWQ